MDSRARDTQGRSLCTSLENAAYTGTSVPSTVAFSSAGGTPLELMAPTRGSAILCAGGAAARIFVWIRRGTTRTDVNQGSV
ncbi:unnamed protein product [Staurois parvus]|uniref:Uncharacterized protein n=1 Tax=Staurois parvus TaxID=386267 RepID=A0ABN9GLJ7_9NEOB|nr:unnamed protein product [Staurois parvus]